MSCSQIVKKIHNQLNSLIFIQLYDCCINLIYYGAKWLMLDRKLEEYVHNYRGNLISI
jgi:hypothetical protein